MGTFQKTIEALQERVGAGPKDRLDWVVQTVQRSLKTPADWQNLRLELAIFIAAQPDGWVDYTQEILAPPEDQTREILRKFGEAIARAVHREPVPMGRFGADVALWWLPRTQCYYEQTAKDTAWLPRAMLALRPLIREYGHLVKECPARVSRGEPDDICGTWFVATRPRQEYCSARCQSRASTRAKREGIATAAMLKRQG